MNKKTKKGAERIRSGFIWFPVSLLTKNGETETRWMRFSSWLERYIVSPDYDSSAIYWQKISWVD